MLRPMGQFQSGEPKGTSRPSRHNWSDRRCREGRGWPELHETDLERIRSLARKVDEYTLRLSVFSKRQRVTLKWVSLVVLGKASQNTPRRKSVDDMAIEPCNDSHKSSSSRGSSLAHFISIWSAEHPRRKADIHLIIRNPL
jgi:hypothetical protein